MPSATESSALEPVAHGGLLDRELAALGVKPDEVLDVSVNVNPYGPSAAMMDAIRGAPIHRYPDPTSTEARRILAESLDADMNDVVLGNGAVDLLWTIVRTFLEPTSAAVIVEPTFSELRGAVVAVGARAVEWRAPEETGFAISLEDVARVVVRDRAKLVYLCAPGNPTGVPVPIDDVAAFARDLRGSIVVLDQAFLSMSTRFYDIERRPPPNVICVRSITKDHAIPGVRVGYLLASRAIAARVEASRPPWTTSAFAQAAMITATRERAFITESRTRWLEDRARLARRVPVPCIESSAPFVLARVSDARALRRGLLERHRVLVRDCTSFGLPHHVRLCARPLADEERLLAALKEELPGC
jgi:histidinol-phosphate/aromatic aminotransferase/cobyric acid decarboxylase-like protein